MALIILAIIYLDIITLLCLFVAMTVLVNIGDHYDLREGNYEWCSSPRDRVVQYLTNLFYGLFTQEINTVAGGIPDNTFSGRIGKQYKNMTLQAEALLDRAWFEAWPVKRRVKYIFVVAMYWLIGSWFFFAKFDFKHCERHAAAE